jgi:hypothetical protein
VLLLRQKIQDDSVESFRVFHIWHMSNTRHHHPACVGNTFKPDHTATLACEDGNGKAVFAKAIACTDFPLPESRLYDTDRTILLPSEY